MTQDELSAAWIELRNAALGRGVSPVVSAPLADRVGRASELWRSWLAGHLGPTGEVQLGVWQSTYAELADAVRAEGAKLRKRRVGVPGVPAVVADAAAGAFDLLITAGSLALLAGAVGVSIVAAAAFRRAD